MTLFTKYLVRQYYHINMAKDIFIDMMTKKYKLNSEEITELSAVI